MELKNIEIDCCTKQENWIKTALAYLPESILSSGEFSLVIVALGEIGACRLPMQYRSREIVFLSDWIFPPLGASAEEDSGRFFILTVLHEVAHAVCRHKSPRFDNLSPESNLVQENEADELAKNWFNQYVRTSGIEYLKEINDADLRKNVEKYALLYGKFLESRDVWHNQLDA